jgi:hypothetical protein
VKLYGPRLSDKLFTFTLLMLTIWGLRVLGYHYLGWN